MESQATEYEMGLREIPKSNRLVMHLVFLAILAFTLADIDQAGIALHLWIVVVLSTCIILVLFVNPWDWHINAVQALFLTGHVGLHILFAYEYDRENPDPQARDLNTITAAIVLLLQVVPTRSFIQKALFVASVSVLIAQLVISVENHWHVTSAVFGLMATGILFARTYTNLF